MIQSIPGILFLDFRVCFNKTQMPRELKEAKSRVFTAAYSTYEHLVPRTVPHPCRSARCEGVTSLIHHTKVKKNQLLCTFRTLLSTCVVVHSKHDKKNSLCRFRQTLRIIQDNCR